jgi:hypothetical protein
MIEKYQRHTPELQSGLSLCSNQQLKGSDRSYSAFT